MRALLHSLVVRQNPNRRTKRLAWAYTTIKYLLFFLLAPKFAYALDIANTPDFRHKLGFATLIFLAILFFCVRAWKDCIGEEMQAQKRD